MVAVVVVVGVKNVKVRMCGTRRGGWTCVYIIWIRGSSSGTGHRSIKYDCLWFCVGRPSYRSSNRSSVDR